VLGIRNQNENEMLSGKLNPGPWYLSLHYCLHGPSEEDGLSDEFGD
jgi:hypothetical protein